MSLCTAATDCIDAGPLFLVDSLIHVYMRCDYPYQNRCFHCVPEEQKNIFFKIHNAAVNEKHWQIIKVVQFKITLDLVQVSKAFVV